MVIILMVILMVIKVEVGGDAERVRAECRAVGDQLGERRSQWRVSFVIETIIDNCDHCNGYDYDYDYDDNNDDDDDIDRLCRSTPLSLRPRWKDCTKGQS